jgi:hypothetical protein
MTRPQRWLININKHLKELLGTVLLITLIKYVQQDAEPQNKNSKCLVLFFTATTDLRAANCIGHGKQCSREGYFISHKAVVLIAVVYVCSLVVTGLLVFYFVPRSSSSELQASDTNLTRSIRVRPQVTLPQQKTPSSNRLPTHIIPTHYRLDVILLCFWYW